jgi:phage terminase small subunit
MLDVMARPRLTMLHGLAAVEPLPAPPAGSPLDDDETTTLPRPEFDDPRMGDAWDAVVGALPRSSRRPEFALMVEQSAYTLLVARHAQQLVLKVGPLIQDRDRQPRTNPAVRIARDHLEQFMRLSVRLGLTPLDAQRLLTPRRRR